MAGSQTPHKLDNWPLADGRQDLAGILRHLNDRIAEYCRDLAVFGPKVDQVAINNILERVMADGLAGMQEDDLPHAMNALAMVYASDEVATCRACLNEILKGVSKARDELN